jgi:hypothetical protein
MNSELTQRLVKRFPVLYQDYHSPMTQTCMRWGFDHGDGWFEIIWQLSLAIEEELGYSWLEKRWFLAKKGFFRWWNRVVYKLSPVQDDKRKREGSGTKEDPYRWVVVEKAPRDCLARMAWKVFPPPVLTIIAVGPQSFSVLGSRHLLGGLIQALRWYKSRKNSERCGSIAAPRRRLTNTYGSRNGSLR